VSEGRSPLAVDGKIQSLSVRKSPRTLDPPRFTASALSRRRHAATTVSMNSSSVTDISCRKFGAGRHDDVGDLDGLPETVVQVAAWSDVLRAVREKLIDAERQRELGEYFLRHLGPTTRRRVAGRAYP
jgi:hypothetical protein